MKIPAFSQFEFVDAPPFNTAFTLVSNDVADANLATWAGTGLIKPEDIGITPSGLSATISLPLTFGIISSTGVLVRAHGTVTNQDTQTYSVNFTSLVPGSGSVTAYAIASIITIQQNPYPIPGPPPGHPSYDPNFIPTVGYATSLYSIAVTATTTPQDVVNTFELFRVTLTAGSGTLGGLTAIGQWRAPERKQAAFTAYSASTVLTPAALQYVVGTYTPNLTMTLPLASNSSGLTFRGLNRSTGNMTVACQAGDVIYGLGATGGSIVLPSLGTVTFYCDNARGWSVMGFNNYSNNVWVGTNRFIDPDGVFNSPAIDGTNSASGASLHLIGNSGTGSKWLRTINNSFQIINNAYNASILNLDDAGNFSVNGNMYTPNTIEGGFLHSTGSIQADLDVYVSRNMNVTGQVTSNTVYSNLLYSYGDVDAAGNASVNGTLYTNNLYVWQNAQLGNLHVTGNAQIDNSVGVSLDVNVNRNVNVAQAVTANYVESHTGINCDQSIQAGLDLIAVRNLSVVGGVFCQHDGNFSGNLFVAGFGVFSGASLQGGNGFYITAGGISYPGSPWNNYVSLVTQYGGMGQAWYTVSDARSKTDVKEISFEDGCEWVKSGRPCTFLKDGVPEAGFLAQDDVKAGRWRAIMHTPDEGERYAKGDGVAEDGERLVRNYSTDIAYHEAVIKGLLERIEKLEARLGDGAIDEREQQQYAERIQQLKPDWPEFKKPSV
jgi:hypothetical protein